MLRWNTSSALCAIMITACPLTSFAQQIVKPAPPQVSILQKMPPLKLPGQVRKVAYEPQVPLVSPEEAVAVNPTLKPPAISGQLRTAALSPLEPMPPIQLRNNPLSPPRSFNATYRRPSQSLRAVEQAASPEIVIRTPFVQPHKPNNYLFVVENVGAVDATTAAVDLFVADGVEIIGVMPNTATSTPRRAHVRLTGLKAGSTSIIEVQVRPTSNVVEFQTRLSSESVHKFTTTANPNFAAVEPNLVAKSSTRSIAVPQTKPAMVSPLTPLAIDAAKATPALPFEGSNLVAASPGVASPTSVADSSPGRTGKAQPPNIANAITRMTQSTKGTPASLVGATKRVTVAKDGASTPAADALLTATVDGPVVLSAQEVADFSITVTNPNPTPASEIVVQLAVPAGLKVTVLDREAWFDEENQTISWEIDNLAAGLQETIKYRAIGQANGQQNQKVTVGMRNVYQGKAQLVTLVSQ
jgi:hypothetical protein